MNLKAAFLNSISNLNNQTKKHLYDDEKVFL